MFKDILINYYKHKPKSEIQDFIKLIYQGAFGGEHLIKNKDTSFNYLLTECNQMELEHHPYEPLYEIISEQYVRVNLSPYLKADFSLERLNDYFSSQKNSSSLITLTERLEIFLELVKANIIKLDFDKTIEFLDNYKENNFPIFHHTENYRNNYNPHYRVVPIDFITEEMKEYQLISYLQYINTQTNAKHIFVAAEGKCASGKTTLIEAISKKMNLTIIHADDFFLKESDKKKYIPVGDYIDYNKIISLIKNLNENDSVIYEKFKCSTQTYEKVSIDSPSKIIILEGVYSYNKHLQNYINHLIFFNVNFDEQLLRLKTRENDKNLEKFINIWIPKENEYYDTFPIISNAELLI